MDPDIRLTARAAVASRTLEVPDARPAAAELSGAGVPPLTPPYTDLRVSATTR